jgi:nucleoside-diphosphate kinase
MMQMAMKGKMIMDERTLAIIKPDAVAAGDADNILALIKKNGFTIVAKKNMHLTRKQAEEFYGVHKGKPFYDELVDFISSGPIIVMVLEKDNAIKAWRDLMGATDPAKAAVGTIRKLYGKTIGSNAVHGSDSPQTAAFEIGLFFPNL